MSTSPEGGSSEPRREESTLPEDPDSVAALAQRLTRGEVRLESVTTSLSRVEQLLTQLLRQTEGTAERHTTGDPSAALARADPADAAERVRPVEDAATAARSSGTGHSPWAGVSSHEAGTSLPGTSGRLVFQDSALWEGLTLPTKVKVDTLRSLAYQGKGDVPYHRWILEVTLAVRAAGAWPLFEISPPVPGTNSQAACVWYQATSAHVHHRLAQAVSHVPVLSEAVLRLTGEDTAVQAWETIRGFIIREAATNKSMLQAKLLALSPGETESMESFLNRCERLRSEYAQYGETLETRDLALRLFSVLSLQWRTAVRLHTEVRDVEGLSWEELKSALTLEDNNRRQSNTHVPDALLPLGQARSKGAAKGADGVRPSPSAGAPRHSPALPRAQSAGGRQAPAPGGTPHGSRPKGRRSDRPLPPIFVCWFCQQGHTLTACPTVPRGPDGKPKFFATEERKEACNKIKEDRKKHQAAQRASALAARASSSSSSSEVGQASGARAVTSSPTPPAFSAVPVAGATTATAGRSARTQPGGDPSTQRRVS